MISRTALILSTLALLTLPTQDANAACKNGVCSMKKAPQPKAAPVRRNNVAAVKTVKGCKSCKKSQKRVRRYNRRNKRYVAGRSVRSVAIESCPNGTCSLRK